jgi:MFS family permease
LTRSRSRPLGRTVWALGLTALFTDVGTEMIFPLLPLFLTQALGASAEMLGFIEGVADATAAVIKLASGWLLDRWPRAKLMSVAGYSLSSVLRPLMALAQLPGQVLAIRVGDRIGKGVRGTARDALLSDAAAAEDQGRVFGFDRSMDHLGAVIGPLTASALLWATGRNLRLVFALSAVPGALAVLVLVIGVPGRTFERSGPPEPPAEPRAVAPSTDPLPRSFWWYLGISGFFALANSSDAFLLLRASELGVAAAAIPLIWIVLHVAKMLSSYPLGIVSDRMGRLPSLLLGFLWYAASYLGFALISGPIWPWVLFALYGIFYGLTEGVGKAFVADLVPSPRRGTGFGFYNGVVGLAALPSGLLTGFVWRRFGGPQALLLCAFLSLLSAVGLLALGAAMRGRARIAWPS